MPSVYTLGMGELKWFILALIIMWILWVLTGGYTERTDNKDKPFIEQPTKAFDSGRPYTFEEFQQRY